MSQDWYSLFVPDATPDEVASALESLLSGQGYHAYDPFPGGTGTPPNLREMVRLFVAPADQGWVRVVGQVDEALLRALSESLGKPVICGWVDGSSGGFTVFREGERHDGPGALKPYLRGDQTGEVLQQAFTGNLPVPPVESSGPPVMVVGADAIPPDVQQLAAEKGVDTKQAGKLFEKLSSSLFGKLERDAQEGSREEQEQARAILSGEARNACNSLNGQRVRAIAGVLRLPDHWRTPEWQTLRDAYHVHRLRERNPRMPLLPGDEDALKAVPDALKYRPVYMGRE